MHLYKGLMTHADAGLLKVDSGHLETCPMLTLLFTLGSTSFRHSAVINPYFGALGVSISYYGNNFSMLTDYHGNRQSASLTDE